MFADQTSSMDTPQTQSQTQTQTQTQSNGDRRNVVTPNVGLQRRRRAGLISAVGLLSAAAFALTGCAQSSTDHSVSTVSPQLTAAQDTSAVVTSLSWGSPQTVNDVVWDGAQVTTSLSADTFTVTSNSIPNHERDDYYAVPENGVVVPDASTATVAKDPTKESEVTFMFPTSPTYSETTTEAPLGSIGMMISGAVLYNPYEGDGNTVAMSNNFTITQGGITASFVDHCSGHPTPQGTYHYHANSSCVTRQVDETGKESHMIGLALDGFPIYGAYDITGAEVKSTSLDECNGIYSPTPEFPDGIYHYVLPNTTDETSSIRCFHGVVDTSQIQQMPRMMGQMGQMGQMGEVTPRKP